MSAIWDWIVEHTKHIALLFLFYMCKDWLGKMKQFVAASTEAILGMFLRRLFKGRFQMEKTIAESGDDSVKFTFAGGKARIEAKGVAAGVGATAGAYVEVGTDVLIDKVVKAITDKTPDVIDPMISGAATLLKAELAKL